MWVLFFDFFIIENVFNKSAALCFYKAMRSQVESFLRDHLVIGKQVLGRKWDATIDQIHCQKRRLLIQLQYFFPQVTILQKNPNHPLTYIEQI